MRLRDFRLSFNTLIAAALASVVWGQPSAPITDRKLLITGSVRTRLEGWSWFQGQGETGYAYSGTLARIALSLSRPRLDWQLELAAPILAGLPQHAVGAPPQGQFGLGAAYFAANSPAGSQPRSLAAQVFPMQGFVRIKSPFRQSGESLRLGRFQFADGAEVVPKNSTLAALKSSRVNQRLIGTFAFTHVQRAFYGVEYRREFKDLTIEAVGALPTRGVFQVDGWGIMKTAFGYASLTRGMNRGSRASEWRVFGSYYDDWRKIQKVDNRPSELRLPDQDPVRVATVGGHLLHTSETPVGALDLVLWGALQGGSWGTQAHRAAAADIEAGFQPKLLRPVKPWVRAGFTYGSGDGDSGDSRHGTFFQMLPTPRLFALFPFYNMMNNQDAFAILVLRPSSRLTIKHESHWVRLADRQDLWYSGGGAFQPWTFGFAGRPSNGSNALANVYDLNVDFFWNSHTTATGYWGYATGRSVVSAIYRDRPNGSFGFVELTVRF